MEKGLFIKTQRRKGVGRVGEGIEVTAVLSMILVYEVLSRSNRTRK